MEMDVEAQIPYVEEDTFQDILSRLPVRTLMTFKSVCTSWRARISDPYFANLHLKQSMNQCRTWFLSFQDCYSALVYEAPLDNASNTNRPIYVDGSKDDVDLVAACNGMFCIVDHEDNFFLWNPSTGEARKIPPSTIEFPDDHLSKDACVFFGLGYHAASGDYKLVRVSVFSHVDHPIEVKIYSRNTNSWKRIGDFPYQRPLMQPGVYVSGCLHWLVSICDGKVDLLAISALDLSKENYRLIQLPGGRKPYSNNYDIRNLGDDLIFYSCSYLDYNFTDYSFDLWILRKYGETDQSWTRINIAPDFVTNKHVAFSYFEPLCFLNPSEILFRIGASRYLVFDINKNRISGILETQMMYRRTICFVESLVSPKAPHCLPIL